jgi:ribosome-binding protein aMBF1 (putative translation factor)
MAAPPDVIAGKQESLLRQQYAVSAGVARRGNREKVRVEFNRLKTIEDALRIRLRRKFQPVDDSLGSKARRIPRGIGDIVAVRQENVAEAASLLEPAGQVFRQSEAHR